MPAAACCQSRGARLGHIREIHRHRHGSCRGVYRLNEVVGTYTDAANQAVTVL